MQMRKHYALCDSLLRVLLTLFQVRNLLGNMNWIATCPN